MTDPRLVAALAAALRTILSDFDREPDDEYMAVAVPMFLSLLPPDWCGHKTAVMLEQEAEAHESTIAALRAALTVIEAEHSAGDHPEWAGWYGEPGERPDLACRTCGTFGEYAVHWPCDTAKIAHAALVEAKETP